MWQKTKHGLYRKFVFRDFQSAWLFISKVVLLVDSEHYYPRWENEKNVVHIWLNQNDNNLKNTSIDQSMASKINSILDSSVLKDSQSNELMYYEYIKIYADGGSRGNPGPSACGYVIMDKDNKILSDQGVYIGITTNNQAEYMALKLALEDSIKYGAKSIDVYMDSLLVINQMKNIFKIKNRELWPVHEAIQIILKRFHHVNFYHIPRELNKLADRAVNRALDENIDKNISTVSIDN